MKELVEAAVNIVNKYHFTVSKTATESHAVIATDFENVTARVDIWGGGFNNGIEVMFHSEVLGLKADGAVTVYNLADKKDQRRLATRTRNFMKKVKVKSEDETRTKTRQFERFERIQQKLIDQKIAFAFSIEKSAVGGEAVIQTNGYRIRVNDNLVAGIRIGTTNVVVPVAKAIEIAELMPSPETL